MSGTAADSRAIRRFKAELPSRVSPGGSRGGGRRADSAPASATGPHALPRGPCRHSVGSARAAHPGCSIGRPRQAGLLACGSNPRITFPDYRPVVFSARHTAYSCGGSPGFYPSSRFNPLVGELVARGERCLNAEAESTEAAPAVEAGRLRRSPGASRPGVVTRRLKGLRPDYPRGRSPPEDRAGS